MSEPDDWRELVAGEIATEIDIIVLSNAPSLVAQLVALYNVDTRAESVLIEFGSPSIFETKQEGKENKALARALGHSIKAGFSDATDIKPECFTVRVLLPDTTISSLVNGEVEVKFKR